MFFGKTEFERFFKDLLEGDTFIKKGVPYVKTLLVEDEEMGIFNSVNLKNGVFALFNDDDIVEKRKVNL